MRFIYSILFALIMVIDWTKGAWAGAVWAVTVNCVGILFGMIVLHLIPSSGRGKKVHGVWWLICIVGAGLYFIPWHVDRGYLIWLHYLTVVLNIAVIGSMLVKAYFARLWESIVGLKKWKMFEVLIFVVMILYMSISPMKSVWPIWYLVLFGIYYMVPISEKRKQQLFQGILNGIIIGFYAIQIWAYGFRPYELPRYMGAYMNSNMNALMYMTTYLALLVKLYHWFYTKNKMRMWWLIYYLVLSAGMYGFITLTGCRTALYITLLLTFVFGVIVFIRNYQNGVSYGKNILRCVCAGVVFPVLICVVFIGCYVTVRYLPCVMHHPVWLEGEYTPYKIHSWDPWDSPQYVDFDEMMNEVNGRMKPLFSKAEQEKPVLLVSSGAVVSDSGVTAVEEFPLDSSWDVRTRIYELYLQNLNWTGHELQDGYFYINSAYHAYHAQNVWLQIAFYYGIPAGIMLIVLTAITGIRHLVDVFNGVTDEWKLFTLLVWVAFFGFGALECVWYPGQMILFLIFFVQKRLDTQIE